MTRSGLRAQTRGLQGALYASGGLCGDAPLRGPHHHQRWLAAAHVLEASCYLAQHQQLFGNLPLQIYGDPDNAKIRTIVHDTLERLR